ncbi:alpha/beta hydrolase family protein [Paracidobacterium acidisoli]|uniref:Acetyl xylan esterase domain-containing protein n=1 Tax=Paracidobacterium acidisoli TaxID=2303751 RepID=A0A372IJY9_9BACT|nr:acetylxylan esterase [Paracidobacterium acidisoli]MBT9332607.1 alpha/beta hydrolase family protein [Paracidobacterium acidisoli]
MKEICSMHCSRHRFREIALLSLLFAATAASAFAQISRPFVDRDLAQPEPQVTRSEYQFQHFLLNRIPPLPSPASSGQWTSQEAQLRKHILDDVIFHGWPAAWVSSAPKFEETGVIETDHGYRIHKLRYEIVPGFTSTALLYEPLKITGKVPAILNLLGHEPDAISVEYEQKRCINFAKRGIIALDMGWVGFGELAQPENAHDYASLLNLAGADAAGFFYLSMRRGLDYLAGLQNVDADRLGVTGLSGGGWQTVVLSALDPRVAVSVEVAGIGSRESNMTHPSDTDEIEEDAPDLMQAADYPELIAMRAPRPSLLIHNATDSCCFRAPMVEPYIYTAVRPFFQLFGATSDFAWHTNHDPGTHNYQLDNRQQAYHFFTEQFELPVADEEIYSDDEIRTPQALAVGLPQDNLTLVSLGRELASQIHREPIPANPASDKTWAEAQRKKLASVVRYEPVTVQNALRETNGKAFDFKTLTYRFDFSNGLSASGLWFREEAAPENAPATIVLDDRGRADAGAIVARHVDRGEQVLALDLLFQSPDLTHSTAWALLADSSGARPLGLEAAQLIAAAKWLHAATGRPVEVQTSGMRSQVVAQIAAALAPSEFSTVVSRNAIRSLGYLFDAPVPFRSAPELFCLDLYRYFDIDVLTALASPDTVSVLNVISK